MEAISAGVIQFMIGGGGGGGQLHDGAGVHETGGNCTLKSLMVSSFFV
jgi:hypothetical protein